jgi:hypothetical protein
MLAGSGGGFCDGETTINKCENEEGGDGYNSWARKV